MFKIANIISNCDLVNHTTVGYINYIDWEDGVEYDQSLPTLVVGWRLFKSLYPTNPETILDKNVKENSLYWEFSFDEKKEDHILGLEMFSINAPYYFFRKNFIYESYDPVFKNIITFEELKKLLPNQLEGVYNFKNNMLYLLSANNIFGIDLVIYEHFFFDTKEITSYFKSISKKYFLDDTGSLYAEHYKQYPDFEELRRYLVVLLSKQ